jgi:hypothetical protein
MSVDSHEGTINDGLRGQANEHSNEKNDAITAAHTSSAQHLWMHTGSSTYAQTLTYRLHATIYKESKTTSPAVPANNTVKS